MTYQFPLPAVEFTKDREQAYVFPSYDAAMEWALAHKGSGGLGHSWRIAGGWEIDAPAIIELYFMPSFTQYVADTNVPLTAAQETHRLKTRVAELEAQLADMDDYPEPDNSDEEPDQLAPGD